MTAPVEVTTAPVILVNFLQARLTVTRGGGGSLNQVCLIYFVTPPGEGVTGGGGAIEIISLVPLQIPFKICVITGAAMQTHIGVEFDLKPQRI